MENQVELSTLCQCAHPDPVYTETGAFCAICGGDLVDPEIELDVADEYESPYQIRASLGI